MVCLEGHSHRLHFAHSTTIIRRYSISQWTIFCDNIYEVYWYIVNKLTKKRKQNKKQIQNNKTMKHCWSRRYLRFRGSVAWFDCELLILFSDQYCDFLISLAYLLIDYFLNCDFCSYENKNSMP